MRGVKREILNSLFNLYNLLPQINAEDISEGIHMADWSIYFSNMVRMSGNGGFT